MTICQCTADICVSHGFLLCEKFQCLNKIQVASYTEVIHKKLVFSFLTTSNYTWLRSAQSSTWFVIFHRICLPYDYAATIFTHLWDFILTTWFGIYFCLPTLFFSWSRKGAPLSPTVFNRKIIAIPKDETNEFTFSLAVVKEQ